MSRYAHVNLLDLDDSVAGRLDGLEGRFGRGKLDSRDLGISHWRYAPNLQVPGGHRHREQEEAYIVVAGPKPEGGDGEQVPVTWPDA